MSAQGAAPSSTELSATLQALGLGPDPALEQTLSRYLDLLQRWNATYNLTSVRERSAMLTQHLADCLSAVTPLRRQLSRGALLDVGSGGGLPGVVLAATNPDMRVTCVDTVGKKAAFVRQAAGELGLPNLQAVHARVEAASMPPQALITSRAFASLALFTRLTERHLAPDGVWMAMKGQVPTEELAELPPTVDVFHVEQLQVPGLDAQRCLVWMRRRGA